MRDLFQPLDPPPGLPLQARVAVRCLDGADVRRLRLSTPADLRAHLRDRRLLGPDDAGRALQEVLDGPRTA